MLYQDWDILLTGKRIRITPMEKRDDEAYGRLMFGEHYDRFVEVLKDGSVTGIEKTLEHRASDETHAIRQTGDDQFIGWITLQRDNDGRPDRVVLPFVVYGGHFLQSAISRIVH